jgi:hypothetical protein
MAIGVNYQTSGPWQAAFEDAVVEANDVFLGAIGGSPDPDDAHVLAAALKTQAATFTAYRSKGSRIVNLSHSGAKRTAWGQYRRQLQILSLGWDLPILQ